MQRLPIINFEYIKVNDKLLVFKWLKSDKNHEKYFNQDLVIRFVNKQKFCDGEIKKNCFMLRKGACPYEYVNSWQRFNETLLPDKKEFYSN